MKVVVCAAGDSKRMGALTKEIPKPLLPLCKGSIIENLLEALPFKLIDEIIIIVGYLDYLIKEKIGQCFNGIKVSYIMNKDYSTTNNMYSIYLSKERIDQSMVFVSADVCLTSKTCFEFISDRRENLILVDNNSKYFNNTDPVKVSINQNIITAIDKKLNLDEVNGVACGMYKLSSSVNDFFNISGMLIEQGKVNFGYIEPIKLMLKKYYFSAFYIENEFWYDIDTPNEYKIVKKYIRKGSDENI